MYLANKLSFSLSDKLDTSVAWNWEDGCLRGIDSTGRVLSSFSLPGSNGLSFSRDLGPRGYLSHV